MKQAGGLEDYLRHPVGRFFAGRTFAHFFVDRELCGLLLWGRPDLDQVREMAAAIEAEAPERAGVHKSLIDARRLAGVDPIAFHEFSRNMAVRGQVMGPNVTHHAIVRPPGVVGATVSGFYSVTQTSFPERIRVFDSLAPALRWLGREGSGLESVIDAVVAAATAVPEALKLLRERLAQTRGRLSLGEAAKAAGVSTRSLQEKLRAAKTSLREECTAVRVRFAQELLAETDTKITSIALEVGCASLQHFSTLFRKATGVSPKEWRARSRRVVGPST